MDAEKMTEKPGAGEEEVSGSEYPFEVKSLERGERAGDGKGWHNTFIVKVNRQTGDTWILTHIMEGKGPGELMWVPVPHVTQSEK